MRGSNTFSWSFRRAPGAFRAGIPLFLLRGSGLGICILALATVLSIAGCNKAPPRPLTAAEFQAKAEAAYQEALEAFHERDWQTVPTLMEEVKREYAGTKWARLAQLRIADALFRQGSYAEAVTAYREFLRDYPSDPNVPYARYRVVLTQFESRGESVMQPPLEERDLVNVRDANRSIDAFLRDYPNYPKREHVLYMQKWVRGMLARHELYVARFYLARDNFDAAIARIEHALVTYKNTRLEPEALVLLGETHMKQGEHAKAKTAFFLVLDRYPESPFVTPARNFLAELSRGARSP